MGISVFDFGPDPEVTRLAAEVKQLQERVSALESRVESSLAPTPAQVIEKHFGPGDT